MCRLLTGIRQYGLATRVLDLNVMDSVTALYSSPLLARRSLVAIGASDPNDWSCKLEECLQLPLLQTAKMFRRQTTSDGATEQGGTSSPRFSRSCCRACQTAMLILWAKS